jgi:hypothetical protein
LSKNTWACKETITINETRNDGDEANNVEADGEEQDSSAAADIPLNERRDNVSAVDEDDSGKEDERETTLEPTQA